MFLERNPVADGDLKMTSFPARMRAVFSMTSCYKHKCALSDVALRSETRSGRRQAYAPRSPPLTALWCINGGQETDLSPQTDALCLKCWTGVKLAPAVCVLSTFRSVFKLNIVCVLCQCLSAPGRRLFLLKPFYGCPTSSTSFLWPVRAQMLTCSNVCYINMCKKEEMWNKILFCLILFPFEQPCSCRRKSKRPTWVETTVGLRQHTFSGFLFPVI